MEMLLYSTLPRWQELVARSQFRLNLKPSIMADKIVETTFLCQEKRSYFVRSW